MRCLLKITIIALSSLSMMSCDCVVIAPAFFRWRGFLIFTPVLCIMLIRLTHTALDVVVMFGGLFCFPQKIVSHRTPFRRVLRIRHPPRRLNVSARIADAERTPSTMGAKTAVHVLDDRAKSPLLAPSAHMRHPCSFAAVRCQLRLKPLSDGPFGPKQLQSALTTVSDGFRRPCSRSQRYWGLMPSLFAICSCVRW